MGFLAADMVPQSSSWTGAQGPWYPHCLVLRHQHGLSWLALGFGSKHWTKHTQNNQHCPDTFRHVFFPNAIARPQQKWSRQHHRSKNPKNPAEQWQNRNNCNSKYVNFAPTKKMTKDFLPSSPNPPQFGASVVQDQRWNKQMTGFWLKIDICLLCAFTVFQKSVLEVLMLHTFYVLNLVT